MRFHAILFVRDEEDIIAESLLHNAQFFDHIYVYDTGSTDQTWEIVQAVAKQCDRVVPFRKEAVWWHDGLRAMVFDHFRSNSEDGDWWARLDADEFYHVSPREFVRQLAPRESAIYHAYYNFRLTVEEAEALADPEAVRLERCRSIQDRRRYFIPAFEYSEPRLFRYRGSMKWSPAAAGPYNAGFVARARIPIRHYPYRDPCQMERRFRLRTTMFQEMRKMSNTYATHWGNDSWRSELIPATDPRLQKWTPPNGELPPCTSLEHLPPFKRRVLQWAAHSFCLPVLDRLRPEYPKHFRPSPLPNAIQERLAEK